MRNFINVDYSSAFLEFGFKRMAGMF